MPTIPSGIKPVVEGYSIGAPNGVTRIPVAGGGARYGLEWDDGSQPFRVTLILDAVQMVIWTAFFHHVVKGGSVAFDMAMDSGFGEAVHSVQVIPGTYSAAREGLVTKVTFAVQAQSDAYDLTYAQAVALVEAYNGYALEVGTPSIPRGLEPVTQGYSYEAPEGVIASDVSGPTTSYARQIEQGPQLFRVTMVMDATKFEAWTAFFHHIIKKGSQSFTMLLDSGLGLQDHTVDILPGTYSVTKNGAVNIVSFGVEAESSVYGMTAAEAESLIVLYEEYRSGLSALLDRIAVFANSDTLVLQ